MADIPKGTDPPFSSKPKRSFPQTCRGHRSSTTWSQSGCCAYREVLEKQIEVLAESDVKGCDVLLTSAHCTPIHQLRRTSRDLRRDGDGSRLRRRRVRARGFRSECGVADLKVFGRDGDALLRVVSKGPTLPPGLPFQRVSHDDDEGPTTIVTSPVLGSHPAIRDSNTPCGTMFASNTARQSGALPAGPAPAHRAQNPEHPSPASSSPLPVHTPQPPPLVPVIPRNTILVPA
eukprot:2503587-Rhodomonas_salina.3